MSCIKQHEKRMYFALIASQALLEPCGVVASALQRETASIFTVLEQVSVVQKKSDLRTDNQVQILLEKLATLQSTALILKNPLALKKQKSLLNYAKQKQAKILPLSLVKVNRRRECTEALNLIDAEPTCMFQQESMKVAASKKALDRSGKSKKVISWGKYCTAKYN